MLKIHDPFHPLCNLSASIKQSHISYRPLYTTPQCIHILVHIHFTNGVNTVYSQLHDGHLSRLSPILDTALNSSRLAVSLEASIILIKESELILFGIIFIPSCPLKSLYYEVWQIRIYRFQRCVRMPF